jgi:hypothetical protein
MLFLMMMMACSPLYRTPPRSTPSKAKRSQALYVYDHVGPVQGALDAATFGLTAAPPKRVVKRKK